MESGWRRLGREVAGKRARLGWSADDLAAEAGLGARTVEYIEAGSKVGYRPTTLAKLEQALGWAPGSCQRIIEGARPRPSLDPLRDRMLDAWPNLSPDMQVTLVTVAENLIKQRQR